MSPFTQRLLAQIRKVAQLHPIVLETVAKAIVSESSESGSEVLRLSILNRISNIHFRQAVSELFDIWSHEAAGLSGKEMAAALNAAAYCDSAFREEMSVELVWTGPNAEGSPMRKTEQALLQLIQEAEQELVIVSFAVYKIPEVVEELIKALKRGVDLKIIAETPESSEGKISFGIFSALGSKIIDQAKVFIWPREKRPTDSEGKHGSLHVKCAIADKKRLFISSANLTEYAFTLNMEMGLLVYNKDLAYRVADHIEGLIRDGTLAKLQLKR